MRRGKAPTAAGELYHPYGGGISGPAVFNECDEYTGIPSVPPYCREGNPPSSLPGHHGIRTATGDH